VIHDGQQYSQAVYYVPLPQPLVERADAKITAITDHRGVAARALPCKFHSRHGSPNQCIDLERRAALPRSGATTLLS